MSVRTHHKLVGIAGAAVLAVGVLGGSAVAAASTASASYTCSTPLGNVTPSVDYSMAAAPAKVAVGQPVKTTAVVTLDATSTGLAEGLGWTAFSGSISTAPSAKQAGLSLSIPKTTLGNGAGGTTTANVSGSVKAGTKPGAFTFVLGDLGAVSLTGYDASGKVGTITFPGSFGQCTNDAGTTSLTQTATVVKDSTTTKNTVKYTAKKKSAAASATVKAKYGTTAAGKVTFTLKKGSKTVKTMSGTLKKGKASVTFKNVKAKGSYSVTSKYAGSSSLTGSSGKKVTFKVK